MKDQITIDINQLIAEYKHATPDICEHMDTLTELAKECDHITEMGFRHGASACAMLKAQPKKLISYDLQIPDACRTVFDLIKGNTEVQLIQGNTLEIEIEPTDMLFIDTLHTYSQLRKELELHGNRASKYLVFHDTETFKHKGEDGSEKGLIDAIAEWTKMGKVLGGVQWELHKHYENNNGLTILKRMPE